MLKGKFLGIRIDEALELELKKRAKAERRPLADYCRIVLEDHAFGSDRELKNQIDRDFEKTMGRKLE